MKVISIATTKNKTEYYTLVIYVNSDDIAELVDAKNKVVELPFFIKKNWKDDLYEVSEKHFMSVSKLSKAAIKNNNNRIEMTVTMGQFEKFKSLFKSE